MPQARSRYQHGDLRAALLATGLELTRSGGRDALRLRKVTRLIGVSPNAAYRHFANHQALLAAIAAELQDRMTQSMSAHKAVSDAQDSAARAVVRLRGVGLGYVDFALDEPGWFQLAFFTPEDIERPDRRVPPPLTLLREALDGLVGTGALTAARRGGAEWSCWSTVHGFAELTIHGPLRHLPPDEVRMLGSRAVDDIITGVLSSY